MSLVCCVEPEPGCTCDINKSCGGIHFINSKCEQHARAGATKSTIHEIGARRVVTVVSEFGDGDLSPSI
jgi:hypothetical protein